MTNFERIKRMSPEQLAGFLRRVEAQGPWETAFWAKYCLVCEEDEHGCCPCDLDEKHECPHGDDALWWLEQEAGEMRQKNAARL